MKDRQASMEDSKSYMSSRQIPQLFESLMTGLMVHKPDDHLDFLAQCINKIKESGKLDLSWNSFVEVKKSSALPPISKNNTQTSFPDKQHQEDDHELDTKHEPNLQKSSPLPPIGSSRESTSLSTASPPKIATKSVPMVLIMGGPGSGKLTQCKKVLDWYKDKNWVHLSIGDLLRVEMLSKGNAGVRWGTISDLVRQGEMAPDDVTQNLIAQWFNSHADADGFLIEGYPRTMSQLGDYKRLIGRVDLAILLECEEEMCVSRLLLRGQESDRIDDNEVAIRRRIEFFKTNTMPVVQQLQKEGKLVSLVGDRDIGEISFEIINIFDVAFYGKRPDDVNIPAPSPTQRAPSMSNKRRQLSQSPPRSSIMFHTDKGRQQGLTDSPMVFIIGGPGSGKGVQCTRLVERFPGFVHLSIGDLLRAEISENGTADERWSMVFELISKGEMAPRELAKELLIANIKKNRAAKGFIIEGYPRDLNQLDDFFAEIGGLNKALVLECKEEVLRKNIEKRRSEADRIDDQPAALEKRLEFFNTYTLPVVKYLDEKNLIVAADGHKEVEELHADLASTLNHIILNNGNKPDSPKITDNQDSAKVAEDSIVPSHAHTTGGDIQQPTQTSFGSDSSGSTDSSGNLSKQHTSTTLKSEKTEVKEPEQAEDSKPEAKEAEEAQNPVKDLTEQETRSTLKSGMSKKVIFVVGGPGCGKGTQCAKIVEKYGFCHLSSGDLLREEVSSGSARGTELNAIMESGALVSLDVVLTLLKEAMDKKPEANGFLIDGYPRELEQGTRFEDEIVPPACVLYFEVPDDVMVERLLSRAKTSGRVDDNEETIKKRLKTFHDHSDKVLEHYKSKGLLCKIDARGSVDDIFGEVVKRVDATN